jgi:hypothetical protein
MTSSLIMLPIGNRIPASPLKQPPEPHLTDLFQIQYAVNMENSNHISPSQVDWNQMNEIWYVAGFGTIPLDESTFHGRGTPNWTVEDMDNVFLNKAKIQAEHPFAIKWEAFDKKHGARVFRMGRTSLLEAVLAFSKNEDSLKPTDDYYDEIENRLGVLLSLHGDDFTAIRQN